MNYVSQVPHPEDPLTYEMAYLLELDEEWEVATEPDGSQIGEGSTEGGSDDGDGDDDDGKSRRVEPAEGRVDYEDIDVDRPAQFRRKRGHDGEASGSQVSPPRVAQATEEEGRKKQWHEGAMGSSANPALNPRMTPQTLLSRSSLPALQAMGPGQTTKKPSMGTK